MGIYFWYADTFSKERHFVLCRNALLLGASINSGAAYPESTLGPRPLALFGCPFLLKTFHLERSLFLGRSLLLGAHVTSGGVRGADYF